MITRDAAPKERFTELPVKQSDCRPTLGKLPDNRVLVNVCTRFWVYDNNAEILLQQNLKFDDTVIAIAPAAAAPRFALIMIEGASRAPLDMQRIQGQSFRAEIYDLASHSAVRSLKVRPMPKLGGAFALSPDGKTLAVLKDGSLEQVPVDAPQ